MEMESRVKLSKEATYGESRPHKVPNRHISLTILVHVFRPSDHSTDAPPNLPLLVPQLDPQATSVPIRGGTTTQVRWHIGGGLATPTR